MANKIILISDNKDENKILLEKLMLLRTEDSIRIVDYNTIKQLTDIDRCIIIINTINITKAEVFKYIEHMTKLFANSIIILLTDITDSDFLLTAYDKGIYDYFSIDDTNYAITLKIMNGLKLLSAEEAYSREQEYLIRCGAIDSKTGLYSSGYIKTMYPVLMTDKKYQNGIFAIISLDDSIKTKISTNRLAHTIKKNIRKNDIAVCAKGGYFYLILQDINVENATNIINKIQNIITEEFPLRAGIVTIGIQNYETLLKNAKDSLNSAIIHNQTVMSLSAIEDNWLDIGDEKTTNKQYKLFQNIYENKLKYVIEPIFFKTQKELAKKLKSSTINQYANTLESSFCLKSNDLQSELIIRFNGYAKLDVSISHSGLYSAENTKISLPLNKLTEKELIKLLKQLKDEYVQSFYEGNKTDAK